MIPYADFLYFGVVLYAVVPAVLLGLTGRAVRRWTLLGTLGMLAVQYGGTLRVLPGAEIREIWIVAGYALFEWLVALAFLRLRARTTRRWPFYTALGLALVPFILAKYVPLVAPRFQFGFLGISFVTLRSLDLIICIQDRLITSLPASQVFTYLVFFATISSGPIDRYRRFAADWGRRRTRSECLQDLDGAVQRIFTGFLYKFVLAALVQQYWLDPVALRTGFASTLSYMYAYSFYLFFDFAGYSAFAIGISYLFGIHTPENFNLPFLARNIRDFWNRWHITLSWWLRDHIYMRFVMAATKGRWFTHRYLASYLGLFLAFALMGLWHGTALNYLLYGLYHGTLLSAHEAFGRWNKRRQLWRDGPLWRAAEVFATFHVVCFGFLLFSGRLTGSHTEYATENGVVSAYEGRFEKSSCEEIAGWAWDAAAPQTPVRVDIVADDVLLATVHADLFRQDLLELGKGNGAHAFVFVPPASLKDERPHSIRVRISGTTVELSKITRSIVCGMSTEAMDGYEGALDRADCELVSGWAWDSTQPERPIAVDVYSDGTLLGTVSAEQARAARRDRGREPDGPHGFGYLIPAHLKDGQPHAIAARISGTNVLLDDTPRIVSCPGAAAERLPATPIAAGPDGDDTQRDGTPSPPPMASGAARLAYVDNGDGTISDPNTGLMWEKKFRMDGAVDAANLHDADNCHPWAGKCATGGADCRLDADCGANRPCGAEDCQAAAPAGRTIFKWVAELNATKFAGHDDWRMPTSTELYSIVNPIEEGDAAAKAAFNGASCGAGCGDLRDPACSCNQPGLYWAASASAPAPDDSWMMFFYCNGNVFLDLTTNRFFIRAVRGER